MSTLGSYNNHKVVTTKTSFLRDRSRWLSDVSCHPVRDNYRTGEHIAVVSVQEHKQLSRPSFTSQ